MDLLLNIVILAISIAVVFIFAKRGAESYTKTKKEIAQEVDFYNEVILGLESVGQNVCRPALLHRETRIAIWELYNNVRVQPHKENKSIVLHRKMLDKKQVLYRDMEEGRVNLEVLPFLGILGTLLGFAVPYLLHIAAATKFVFQVTGLGFFLAASSTICALVALTYLKKKYEAEVMAQWEYYQAQQQALEKIMVGGDGFRLFETWLCTWPDEAVAVAVVNGEQENKAKTQTEVNHTNS